MDNMKLAEAIVDALNAKGASLGNASNLIVDAVLEKHNQVPKGESEQHVAALIGLLREQQGDLRRMQQRISNDLPYFRSKVNEDFLRVRLSEYIKGQYEKGKYEGREAVALIRGVIIMSGNNDLLLRFDELY